MNLIRRARKTARKTFSPVVPKRFPRKLKFPGSSGGNGLGILGGALGNIGTGFTLGGGGGNIAHEVGETIRVGEIQAGKTARTALHEAGLTSRTGIIEGAKTARTVALESGKTTRTTLHESGLSARQLMISSEHEIITGLEETGETARKLEEEVGESYRATVFTYGAVIIAGLATLFGITYVAGKTMSDTAKSTDKIMEVINRHPELVGEVGDIVSDVTGIVPTRALTKAEL